MPSLRWHLSLSTAKTPLAAVWIRFAPCTAELWRCTCCSSRHCEGLHTSGWHLCSIISESWSGHHWCSQRREEQQGPVVMQNFVKGVGGATRRLGQALESLGLGLQGGKGYKETCASCVDVIVVSAITEGSMLLHVVGIWCAGYLSGT